MSLEMMTPECFVQIMKDKAAGKDQNVNETVFDDVGQQASHARGDQRAGGGHGNRGGITQHVEPDAMSLRQLAASKAAAFHFFQESGY
jgi:hypothetical protein